VQASGRTPETPPQDLKLALQRRNPQIADRCAERPGLRNFALPLEHPDEFRRLGLLARLAVAHLEKGPQSVSCRAATARRRRLEFHARQMTAIIEREDESTAQP